MPEDTIVLQESLGVRRSERAKHPYVISVPTTTVDAHQTSSLNTIRRIWNHTPRDLVLMDELHHFKSAMKNSNVYTELVKNPIIGPCFNIT